VQDASEEAFGARPITSFAKQNTFHWDKVLCAGKNEDVSVVVINRKTIGDSMCLPDNSR
jgi:hypothetical protein